MWELCLGGVYVYVQVQLAARSLVPWGKRDRHQDRAFQRPIQPPQRCMQARGPADGRRADRWAFASEVIVNEVVHSSRVSVDGAQQLPQAASLRACWPATPRPRPLSSSSSHQNCSHCLRYNILRSCHCACVQLIRTPVVALLVRHPAGPRNIPVARSILLGHGFSSAYRPGSWVSRPETASA
jgi:hypothetical protein